MDIHTAAKYMQHGYRIRRQEWGNLQFIGGFRAWIDQNHITGRYFKLEDFLADDWEIVFEGILDDREEVEYEPDHDEEEESD